MNRSLELPPALGVLNLERVKGRHEHARVLFERAKGCQEHAIEMFEFLGLPAEAARVRWAIAQGLIRRGEYNESIAALWASREEFLRLGMPIVSAEVAVDSANALLLAGRGRWIQQLCNDAITVLMKAGIDKEASKALAYLREEAASNHRAHKSDEYRLERAISHVRGFLSRLQTNSELPFDEPED